ncbi:hypothetical protein [Spirosoma linguale]|uniref:Uncharacterized protein n=1 Tax=Spirosoma linguale (strain ATCC 33905 / DSM 74 / LMG 10896 / Claus 1) TaxID=504472 RepID=D2QHR5_SPILD|nr:hypothetical protein Slin_3874 [Spirosoma linguale DSM 74]
MESYDETDFVLYALAEMKIPVQHHTGKHITLTNGYQIEVEKRDLYRLSVDGFVISPFDDMGELCQFIQRNGAPEQDD